MVYSYSAIISCIDWNVVHGHVQMMALSSWIMMDSHRFFHCVGSTPIMLPNFTECLLFIFDRQNAHIISIFFFPIPVKTSWSMKMLHDNNICIGTEAIIRFYWKSKVNCNKVSTEKFCHLLAVPFHICNALD